MEKVNHPINRVNKFFQLEDFNLENDMGREYLTDLNMTVSLFKIDYKKSKSHVLYGETRAEEKITLAPIELQVRVTIDESESKFMAGTGIKREYAGNLTFTVYDVELEEKNVDVNYGDYIGYINPMDGKMSYYEVAKNDKINSSNSKTHLGFKSYYRVIECVAVDPDVFNG